MPVPLSESSTNRLSGQFVAVKNVGKSMGNELLTIRQLLSVGLSTSSVTEPYTSPLMLGNLANKHK
ncbi:hypothetical protein [Vibrio sinensis]|uniref:hypothetical protein n=1 Tax=Vibrio sinensis TaxID=2302434 RepID=UPI0010584349|nr:hypothetical protein [Vibrio sinensis]